MPRLKMTARQRRILSIKQRFINRNRRALIRIMVAEFRAMLQEFELELILRGVITKSIRKADAITIDTEKYVTRMGLKLGAKLGSVYDESVDLERGANKLTQLAQEKLQNRNRHYIEQKLSALRQFTQNEARRASQAITDAIDSGAFSDPNRASAEFKALAAILEGKTARGAERFAEDVIGESYEKARLDYWQTSDVADEKVKEWVPSVGGDHDRVHHNEIPARGPVPLDGMFEVHTPDGEIVYMRHPKDFDSSPEESYNCGCGMVITERRKRLRDF